MPNHSQWKISLNRIKDMYLMPFRAIAAAMRQFKRNRDRVRAFSRRPGVAATLKWGMFITLLLWLLIAFLNRGEQDNRLSDAVRELWPEPSGSTRSKTPAAE